MKNIPLHQIAALCGASTVRYAPSDPAGERSFSVLSTDSRTVDDAPATVFAAMRTSVGDGHNYIADVAARGVKAFIVDHIPAGCSDADATFIIVPDVAAALRRLAKSLPVDVRAGILVTGSGGKTKTKELIYRALNPHVAVSRSPRSWNSALGLVLSMWEYAFSEPQAEYIVTEAGIDAPGQGAPIADLTAATHRIGVITPLTDEHDEAFESHAAKVAEKIAVVSACNTIIISDGDPELVRQAREYCSANGKKLVCVSGADEKVLHSLAAEALKAADAPQAALDTLTGLPTADTRRRISAGVFGTTVVRDAFTPDLRSLADSVDFFRRHCTGRPKVLVVGEMAEEHRISPERLQQNIAELARKAGIASVVDATAPSAPAIAEVESGNVWRDVDVLIFGEKNGSAAPYAKALEGADHDTSLDVDLDAIVHNYNFFRRLLPPGTGMVAMVKASAYGTGAIEIGKTLQDAGAAYLAVAVIEEGVQLRAAGITMPIVVLNPITNRYPALFARHLEPAVFSPGELDRLIAEATDYGVKDYPVHIKLDTGMHRVGFLENELPGIVERLKNTDTVRVASVLSHLATADCLDKNDYTLGQIATFNKMADCLAANLPPFKRHILNTAGMLRFADSCSYDMARLGIGLYGIDPFPGATDGKLRPVAALNTHIISLKEWENGTSVGYGCKGLTRRHSLIATIPIGYADGINRHLGGGNASFIVNGVACPTIGNICMDQCMIDVTDAPGAAVGTKVEIFGASAPVERLSDTLGTIPYEILTSVGSRVRRVYTRH